jgi:hypothetical protein
LYRNLNYSFHFSKPGFLQAGAEFQSAGGKVILALPPSDPHHLRQRRSVDSRGVVEILMYPEGTPVAEYAPLWRRTDTVPPEIVTLANKAHLKQGTKRPGKNYPVERYALVNQYGDYRIIWVWRDPKLPLYRAELVEVISSGGVSLYSTIDTATSAGPPTPEDISEKVGVR